YKIFIYTFGKFLSTSSILTLPFIYSSRRIKHSVYFSLADSLTYERFQLDPSSHLFFLSGFPQSDSETYFLHFSNVQTCTCVLSSFRQDIQSLQCRNLS